MRKFQAQEAIRKKTSLNEKMDCQSVNGEEVGKLIFAHLFQEDIKKQASRKKKEEEREGF